MTMQLRSGIVSKQPQVELSGEVECDEMYLNAGHKGNREAVKKKVVQDGDIARQKAVESSSRFIAFSKGFGVVATSKKKNHRSLG